MQPVFSASFRLGRVAPDASHDSERWVTPAAIAAGQGPLQMLRLPRGASQNGYGNNPPRESLRPATAAHGHAASHMRDVRITIREDHPPAQDPLALACAMARVREFECVRHGTESLIAALDVHSGRVMVSCTDWQTQADLVAFMEQVALAHPEWASS